MTYTAIPETEIKVSKVFNEAAVRFNYNGRTYKVRMDLATLEELNTAEGEVIRKVELVK